MRSDRRGLETPLECRTVDGMTGQAADLKDGGLRYVLHQFGNGQRVLRGADRMPVVGKKQPGGQEERMKSARPADGQRQTLEICVIEFAAPLEQAHHDKKAVRSSFTVLSSSRRNAVR